MKAVILAGGFGTRLSEETSDKAKPMVKIGNKPILIHIVENFVSQGFNEFVFCNIIASSDAITNNLIPVSN